MKSCPTCGREIAESASACDSCEAWAAALVEARPADDAVETVEALPAGGNLPVLAAPRVPAKRAGSPRQLMIIGAVVAAVALTGFAMSARGGSPSEPAAAAAAAAAPIAAVTPAPPTVPPVTAATAVERWSTANQAAWVDTRRRGAAFELLSENVVTTWFGRARPGLVVRCESQRIEAFVVTGSPLKIDPRVAGKAVTVSIDGEPVRAEHWIDADDHSAVFAPDPVAFTQRLRTARMLQFGYSPHNSSDVVAQFHVAGLEPLMSAASKACGATK